MRLTGLFCAFAFAEPSMDLGTGAVAKEDVDRRVEREEVDHELKDLQHLVKTRGYIAQLEQDVKGLWEALGSAGPDEEAPGMQGGGGMEGDNICPSPTLAGRKRQRGESDVNGKTRDQKRGDIQIFDRGAELSQMIGPEGDRLRQSSGLA